MKQKIISRLLIAFALSLIGINANAFQVDDISYSVLSETDCTVEVVKQSSPAYSGDIIIPETVTYNDKIYTVTQIGSYAFYNCSSLNSVKLPNSINTIINDAFKDSGITSIDLGNSVSKIDSYVFQYCESLTEIELPQSLTSLGYQAFGDCISLKKAVFLSETINFNRNIFSGCTSLEEVILPSKITTITERFFQNCTSLKKISIPETVTTIDYMAFSDCSSLKSITIPKSVTTIKGSAFYDCTSLESINLHDDITSLGEEVFRYCKSLKSIIIPSKLSIIPKNCFWDCESLTEIIIPEGVTTIESYAFDGCTSLSKINIPQTITAIKSAAFRNTAITSIEFPQNLTEISFECFRGCSNLTELTIPEKVTTIDERAFANISTLKSIDILGAVTTIGKSVFAECKSLTAVNLSDGIALIGEEMFKNCSNLENITIPNSVTEIAPYAFSGCSKLKDIKLSENLETIWYGAFSDCTSLEEIVIPKSVKTLADANEYTSGASVGFRHDGVFRNCSQLKNVVFENESELEIIGSFAYEGCEYLNEIRVPENVTRIGDYPFPNSKGSKLYGLLELPSTITHLGMICIWTNYKVCKIKAITPPELSDTTNCLSGNITMVIVPKGSGTAYKSAAGWKKYTIVEDGSNDVEVTVTTPGYMAVDIMEQAGVAPAKVTTLKVHGKINKTDFNVMKSNMLNCYSIDLSDADCDTIPDDAFNGKTYLIGFTLPQNCKYIGKNAFKDCSLSELSLPNGLETISDYAFYGTNIGGNITFPASVKNIGSYAFSGLARISGLDLSKCEDMTTINRNTFSNIIQLKSVSLPYTITQIGQSAFQGCVSLKEFSFPTTLTNVGNYAFADCSNLETIDFDDSEQLTTIGTYAFSKCTALKEFAINGITSLNLIDNYAFSECLALEHIALPGTLKKIGNYAFYKCSALNQVEFLPYRFEATPMSDYNLETLTYLEMIGNNGFDLCTSLESISLPYSVKSIGQYVFSGCYALKYADLSKCKGLTTLPRYAFNDNFVLEVINLPSSLKTVEQSALRNCNKLSNISVSATTPPTVANADAFTGVDTENCVLSVPTTSYVDYVVSEHWGAFVSLCKGIIVDKDENVDVYFRHLTAEDLELPHNAQQISNVKATSVADVTTPKEYGAIVVDGSSVYAKNNGYIKFILDIAEGYEIKSVLYNDIDVTDQVVNNTYITPAVTVKGTLKVTTGIPTGIEQIETDNNSSVDAIEVARYDIHGRLLSEPTNGINIVKYSDGSTRKECVK